MYFLGIEFARSKEEIIMHQRKYSSELISETGLAVAKLGWSPIDTNEKLTSRLYHEQVGKMEEDRLIDQAAYQQLIGKLPYLTVTRLDIAFNV